MPIEPNFLVTSGFAHLTSSINYNIAIIAIFANMTVKEICDLFAKEGYLINYLSGGPIYILYPHTFHIYSSDGKYDRVSGIYDYAVAIHTKLVFDQDGNFKEYADFDFRFRKPSNRTMFSMPTCGIEHVTADYITAYCKQFAELLEKGDELAEQQAIKNSTTELLKQL